MQHRREVRRFYTRLSSTRQAASGLFTAFSAAVAGARAPTGRTCITRRGRSDRPDQRQRAREGAHVEHHVVLASLATICTSRCPQKIPITEVMYTLKRLAIRDGLIQRHRRPGPGEDIHRLRGSSYGRSFELGLASRFHLFNKPMSPFEDGADWDSRCLPEAEWPWCRSGSSKIEQLASHHSESSPVGRPLVKYAYYPGCSLEVNSAAYDVSVRAVADLNSRSNSRS
jgi:Fe-S oxidoreductase